MIKHVPSNELKPFDFYERGINEIIRRAGGRLSFNARDVYRKIRADQARLFRVDDVGFFVIEPCVETMSGEPFLNVWLCWFLPGEGLSRKREVIEALDKLAEFHGCEWIDFATTREGWVELLKDDFEEHSVTLRRMR